MDQAELQAILAKHRKWQSGEKGGERADLTEARLTEADLTEARLRWADLTEADLREANLTGANLTGADLREARLRWADLTGARLTEADFKGANIDLSCLPLWCGSLKAHFDDRQLKQIAYHLVSAGLYSKNASIETKRELAKIIDFANGFHRVEECGELTWEEE